MKIIGLTGGSGTGKSTVARLLAAQGAGIVDADAIYCRLCKTSRPMLLALREAFGSAVLTSEGALNRPALAALVFSDAEKLLKLNAVTTPFIRAASLAAFETLEGCPFVLYDAPTLFETGADVLCEAVIGVLADKETRLRRVMRRDWLSAPDARARIAAQPPNDFYRAKCRYLIENSGSLSALETAAAALYQTITKGEKI